MTQPITHTEIQEAKSEESVPSDGTAKPETANTPEPQSRQPEETA